MPYTIFDHTADIGIDVEEKTMEKAFETAAKAVYEIMTEKAEIKLRKEKTIRCSAPDPEQLLVDFLSELLYLCEVKQFIGKEVRVTIKEEPEWRLVAAIAGDKYELGDGIIKTEIKAVTYHMLEVDGGRAKVLFDI